jgi:hypothetical protein
MKSVAQRPLGPARLALLACMVLAACERSTTEPFPQVGPGQFSFTTSGAMQHEADGSAVFQTFDDSRTVLLADAAGYPRLWFEGGYFGPAFAFPVGTHQLDHGFGLTTVVLELSPNPDDWYFGYNGEMRVKESDAGHIVATFEFTAIGRDLADSRVRGSFHAVPGPLPTP